MFDEPVFVDTTILVYAHGDNPADQKTARAKQCVETLWNGKTPPVVSVQVLQEFYVTLVRRGIPQKTARDTVLDYATWHVVDNDVSVFTAAFTEQQRWKLSFWDALILSAARKARAQTLLSEDLNPGQDYDGPRAINPLLP